MKEELILFDNPRYNIYINKEINQKLENIKIITNLIEYEIQKRIDIRPSIINLYYYFFKNKELIFTLNFDFELNQNYMLNKILIYNHKINKCDKSFGNNKYSYLEILDKFLEYL